MDVTSTFLGKIFATFIISMTPVVELRGAIPFGVACGLPLPLVCVLSVLGNLIPVPLIILFIRKIFEWLRKKIPKLDGLILKIEKRSLEKSDLVKRSTFWGLFLFVAIPIPGTGAWTGAVIAALLEVRLKIALPAIILGVLTSAVIVSCLTFGVGSLFFF